LKTLKKGDKTSETLQKNNQESETTREEREIGRGKSKIEGKQTRWDDESWE